MQAIDYNNRRSHDFAGSCVFFFGLLQHLGFYVQYEAPNCPLSSHFPLLPPHFTLVIILLCWGVDEHLYSFLSRSFRGRLHCSLEDSRLPFQWGCYMPWYSEVSMMSWKASHLSSSRAFVRHFSVIPSKLHTSVLFFRIFESKDYLWNKVTVFHSLFLSACQKRQSVKSLSIGHYVLPPASIQDGKD